MLKFENNCTYLLTYNHIGVIFVVYKTTKNNSYEMKPSELIKQISPAQLSEVRREITGKAFRQEHSTRDKKRLLAKIEEIERIITRLGYQIKIKKNEKDFR